LRARSKFPEHNSVGSGRRFFGVCQQHSKLFIQIARLPEGIRDTVAKAVKLTELPVSYLRN
jgi:hypothetical protein